MKRIVSVAVMIAMLIILAGCSSDGKVKISFDTKEYKMENLKVKAEVPHFSGFLNSDFENQINDQYEKNINQWIEEFISSSQNSSSPEHKFVYEFDLVQRVKNNNNCFVSIITEIYTFTGGAHGATKWIAKNIDVQQSKEISLKDLFKDGEDYKALLDRIMIEMVESKKNEYADLWEIPVISDSEEYNFYIQNGNLVIFYHPYELSYYARGFVEFPIKLKDLQPYLKEEYYRLM